MPPRKSFEYALLLIARQHGGGVSTAKSATEELERWRDEDPANEICYQLALRSWITTNPSGLEDKLPKAELVIAASRRREKRRQFINVIGVAGLFGLTGGAARWLWLQPVETVALSTARAENLSHRMSDGTQLDLGAKSSARVIYYRNRREAFLARGDMRFAVQRNPERPFTVSTRWGRVQVLGTVFTVSARDTGMSVEVAEGHVAVWANYRNGEFIGADDQQANAHLHAGDAVTTNERGMESPHKVPVANIAAWKEGWLVFDNTTLADVIARWNDYLYQPLLLADDQKLRNLRMTGSFQLRDPYAFLKVLPKTLPVRISRNDQGAAVIVLR